MNSIKGNTEVIKVQWLHDKYGNFIKGKVYEAVAYARMLNGRYTDYKITDEDGDTFTLSDRMVGKDFIILGGAE